MIVHQVMEETANEILKQIPAPVDLDEVTAKYPVLYEQSMNTVVIQEIIRSVPAVSWLFLLAIYRCIAVKCFMVFVNIVGLMVRSTQGDD